MPEDIKASEELIDVGETTGAEIDFDDKGDAVKQEEVVEEKIEVEQVPLQRLGVSGMGVSDEQDRAPGSEAGFRSSGDAYSRASVRGDVGVSDAAGAGKMLA